MTYILLPFIWQSVIINSSHRNEQFPQQQATSVTVYEWELVTKEEFKSKIRSLNIGNCGSKHAMIKYLISSDIIMKSGMLHNVENLNENSLRSVWFLLLWFHYKASVPILSFTTDPQFWIIITKAITIMALNDLLIQQLEISEMIWLLHMVSFSHFSSLISPIIQYSLIKDVFSLRLHI